VKLKSTTVEPNGAHPQIWKALFRLDTAWRQYVGYELVITSFLDGKHSATSRHYLGTAIDMRTWDAVDSARQLTGNRRKHMLDIVQTTLGSDWFVLDEKTHFHLDYRPRYKND
jgi:hypothetical protein